jgi:hypothetical protein
MRFWKRETDLERQLRAQRPQPREQFVQMLSRQNVAPPRTRQRRAPAFALVAVVTVMLATSLGVAGALGNASHSVKTFYTSASHIYNWNGNSRPRDPSDPGDLFRFLPFRAQYGTLVPLCFVGPPRHTVFVGFFTAIVLLIFDPEQYSPGFCRRL